MGKLAHEADGVGEQHRLPTGQVELAGARVEGGEQPVLDEHVGARQAVEQRRLAGVGVADEGDEPVARPVPAATLGAPGPVELAEVGLEATHPAGQPPAVDLELGLARAPGADAAGLLAEDRPRPRRRGSR